MRVNFYTLIYICKDEDRSVSGYNKANPIDTYVKGACCLGKSLIINKMQCGGG